VQFLPDSAEQIAECMVRTGLRDKLSQAVEEAIARANVSQHNSRPPTNNKFGEANLGEDALLK
jgi:hypothetical protein